MIPAELHGSQATLEGRPQLKRKSTGLQAPDHTNTVQYPELKRRSIDPQKPASPQRAEILPNYMQGEVQEAMSALKVSTSVSCLAWNDL